MNVRRATEAFEAWTRRAVKPDADDLTFKHCQMSRDDPFLFLRATYYHWCELFRESHPYLADAPVVPSVGDAHAENFGTWRDAEGRPVWGVNDLDEADRLPYTNDLVRLATSLRLACRRAPEGSRPRALSTAVMRGYRASLDAGGPATILSDDDRGLGPILGRRADQPEQFWAKLRKHSPPPGRRPPRASSPPAACPRGCGSASTGGAGWGWAASAGRGSRHWGSGPVGGWSAS